MFTGMCLVKEGCLVPGGAWSGGVPGPRGVSGPGRVACWRPPPNGYTFLSRITCVVTYVMEECILFKCVCGPHCLLQIDSKINAEKENNVKNAVVDLRGALPVRAPPMVHNFLNFMQFFGKFGKIIGWHPLPGGLAPPPTENPGSAPETV